MKGPAIRAVYSYWEGDQEKATGTVKELSEKTNKKEGYFYLLKSQPTKNRIMYLEGYMKPVYELYTKDGKVKFTGTAEQCADYMDITRESFPVLVYITKKGKRNGKNGGLLVREAGLRFFREE